MRFEIYVSCSRGLLDRMGCTQSQSFASQCFASENTAKYIETVENIRTVKNIHIFDSLVINVAGVSLFRQDG